jgi:hypothetical protein
MKSFLSSISAVFAALAACTCCVGPLMALAGMLGVSVSHLIWLTSIKNYLIVFSLIVVGYNLYRAYYPKEDSCCTIDLPEETPSSKTKKIRSIFQSKTFLWSVAALTLLILLLPYL